MSQLYDISVVLSYDYGSPAAASRHVLRLAPQTVPGEQRVIAALISADPSPDARRDGRDFWGTSVVELSYASALKTVSFRLSGKIERTARPPQLDLSPDISRLTAEIAERRSLAPGEPHHFLGASDRVQPSAEITAFARDLLMLDLDDGLPVMQAVARLGTALHKTMTFDPDATQVDTPPLEAFVARRGVCQDYAHIMIAALRGLGIPTGYVSGLLRTAPPPGQPRLEGADAMHAWISAWCGTELGWVQYDPTNDVFVGLDHIVIGHGRDYADVSPIRGALRAAGAHSGRQAVDVVPLD